MRRSAGRLPSWPRGKSGLHSILSGAELKAHKTTYYLERRDQEFEEKMAQVLVVYKQVQQRRAGGDQGTHTILSYDEKPGIEAIGTITADLASLVGKYPGLNISPMRFLTRPIAFSLAVFGDKDNMILAFPFHTSHTSPILHKVLFFGFPFGGLIERMLVFYIAKMAKPFRVSRPKVVVCFGKN